MHFGWRPSTLPMVLMLVVLALMPPIALGSTTLNSVQHRATFDTDEEPVPPTAGMSPPERLIMTGLSKDGIVEDAAFRIQSKFTYVGCYQASMSITRDSEQDNNFDPVECIEVCKARYPTRPSFDIIAAVHGPRCGCSFKPITNIFIAAPEGNRLARIGEKKHITDRDEYCTFPCKYYDNPICGGPPDYWGVFMEYSFQSLASQGAYDPWRYVWYTIVAIPERDFTGALVPDDRKDSERYYLHAASTQTGAALFQLQIQLPGLVHGIQYDLDSSRLVGLLHDAGVGRTKVGSVADTFEYFLFIIDINATVPTYIRIGWDEEIDLRQIPIKQAISTDIVWFTGTSTILSKTNVQMYIFTQAYEDGFAKSSSKHRIYFVDIPTGRIIDEFMLDMVVYQLMANEKYGDITATGNRFEKQIFAKLAKVYYSLEEQAKKVNWLYNSYATPFMVAEADFQDLWIQPGMCTSDHLYNNSYIFYKRYPNDYTQPRDPRAYPLLLMEVNIELGEEGSFEEWCNQEQCEGTVDYRIPYAAVYQKEPRIPLSLAAPSLVHARYKIEGGRIEVKFDRPTLRGALPKDTDGDVLPNVIDYMPQLVGSWDCAKVFDVDTVKLIGEYEPEVTFCTWQDDSTIEIVVSKETELEVGDQLFLLPDTIYTIPRPQDDEYSMAASGGIQVGLPDPLVPPVISVEGSNEVEFCSPVLLNADSGTYNTGGRPVFEWDVLEIEDLNGQSDRVYNQTKIQLLRAYLDNATSYNMPALNVPTEYIEPGTKYDISLTVTSRWGLTSNYTIELSKLDFPAPMVEILGPVDYIRNRTMRITLLAVGTPSQCNFQSNKLGYEWSEISGQFDFADFPDIDRNSKSLVIPPMTLDIAPAGEEYRIYNFTVACFTEGERDKASYASVAVWIQRSPIKVNLAREDRVVSWAQILVLDARTTEDPDEPTPPGMTFKGTFRWWCLDPQSNPCFPDGARRLADESGKKLPPVREQESGFWNYDRRLQTTRTTTTRPGLIDPLEACVTDINGKFTDGGMSFSTPIFPSDLAPPRYCRWARGVFMMDPNQFPEGDYTFTIEATASYDGTVATKSVTISISPFEVPSVLLTLLPELERYPITSRISIEGTIESELDPNANVEFDWQTFIYGQNPEYNADRAANALAKGERYTIPAFTYLDQSQIYDITNTTMFFARSDVPNLVIKPNVLQPSKQYKFRLISRLDTGQEGYSEISVLTAGLPPMQGTLFVDPMNGTMNQPRTLMALDWTADDMPLFYAFGYIKYLPGGSEAIRVMLSTEPLPVKQYTVDQLPVGEPSTNYSLTIFCDILTPYFATTTKKVQVQSRPPDNVDEVVNSMLEEAKNADPETALQTMTQVLDLYNAPSPPPGVDPRPEDVAVMSEILTVLEDNVGDAPLTPATATNQAVVINSVVDAGLKDMRTMDAMEDLIIKSAEDGLFDINNPTLMVACLNAIGGILPDEGPTSAYYYDYYGAAGTSTGMSSRRYVGTSASARMSLMEKYHNPDMNAEFNSLDGVDGSYSLDGPATPLQHIYSTYRGRFDVNHKRPFEDERVIDECPSAYCDILYLKCIIPQEKGGHDLDFTCCDAANPKSLCNDPPCWFRGNKCPVEYTYDMRYHGQRSKAHSNSRRLIGLEEAEWRSVDDFDYGVLGWDVFSGMGSATPRELFTVQNGSLSLEQRIADLEKDEVPLLLDVRAKLKQKVVRRNTVDQSDARQELEYAAMDPGIRVAKRAKDDARYQKRVDKKMDEERDTSQIITRAAVLRDTICKQAIVQLTASEPPLRFVTPGFVIWMGRTRNLSEVNAAFVFPSKYAVPPTAPNSPTPDNPITAFSFIYVEYIKNIYGWSDSTPPGNETVVITLHIMRANTVEYEIKNETQVIRVFADRSLFSSALCMYWDRFAPNTAGGAWSTKGILNDGDGGCVTTHLSDIGLFIDGRLPETINVKQAVSYYMETTEDVGTAFSQMAILGFTLAIGMICALWGYIQDELVREAEKIENGRRSAMHLDSDGIGAKRMTNDPIAYEHLESARAMFVAVTFRRVLCRDHALLAPLFYHEKFTRPQRVLCLGVMVTCVLAVNAAIYGIPDKGLMSSGQFVASGVVSGLLAFPIYVFMCFMFSARPFSLQRRLIKRRTERGQYEAIEKVRKELEAKSSRPGAPEKLLQLPPTPAALGSHVQVGTGTSLLALPPALPPKGMPSLPPPVKSATMLPALGGDTPSGLPTAVPMLPYELPVANLPPLPLPAATMTTGFNNMAKTGLSGLPGLPNLPPLPKLQALPGSGKNPPPPPPKYPSGGLQPLQYPGLMPALPDVGPGGGGGRFPPLPGPPSRGGNSNGSNGGRGPLQLTAEPGTPTRRSNSLGNLAEGARTPPGGPLPSASGVRTPPGMPGRPPPGAPPLRSGNSGRVTPPGGPLPGLPPGMVTPPGRPSTPPSRDFAEDAQHNAAPAADSGPSSDGEAFASAGGTSCTTISVSGPGSAAGDVEAVAADPRELRESVEHAMMAGAPDLPKMQGPPPKRPSSSQGRPPSAGEVHTPPSQDGFMTPPIGQPEGPLLPGRLTPLGGSGRMTPIGGSNYGTPRTPQMKAPSTPGSAASLIPSGMPPLQPPIGGITRGIVHRGEAFIGMPPPFKPPSPQQPGPGGGPLEFPKLGGMSPPPRQPPPPPPPPPPPKEDDATFVRRTRLQYMENAAKLHQEMIMRDQAQDVPWDTPDWVFTVTLTLPYIAATISIMLYCFVNLAYSLKFQRIAEQHWLYASLVGLGLVLVILEVLRAAIMTIIELRKFETRRLQFAGEHLTSKIRAMGAAKPKPILAPPKAPPKKPPVPERSPKVPSGKPPQQQADPTEGLKQVGNLVKAASGPKLGNLPVQAGPPPQRPSQVPPVGFPPMPGAGGTRTPPFGNTLGGTATPPQVLSGRLGASGTIGSREDGMGLLPGRLTGTGGRGGAGPALPGPPPPPPGMIPGGVTNELSRSLTQKLQENALAAGNKARPPQPGAPPPPAGGTPQSGSRQPSARRSPPKTPPPGGDRQQQVRNHARQQQVQKQG